MTTADLDLVEDERFQPIFDRVHTYFDVDAALVRIPDSRIPQFSPAIPHLGAPTGVIIPDFTSVEAYAEQLVGTKVAAYSWKSRLRRGEITHVFYVTRARPNGTVVMYSFLVKGAGGIVPGLAMDSGKVWAARGDDGGVEIVGLHQGVVGLPNSVSKYAVATEFFSLAKLLRIRPIASMSG